jgi:polyisoprenoid-binding protein YceI
MSMTPGTHKLGPQNGELLVHTRRAGAAAKAGHDLVIDVTRWTGTLELGEDRSATSITLSANPGSLRVREGRGGIQALGDDDKDNIEQTIDDEVLKGSAIEFHSTKVDASADDDTLHVRGELDLIGTKRPIAFELTLTEDGKLAGSAIVVQTDWGIKPYSALFGALKVADEVEVTIQATLAG